MLRSMDTSTKYHPLSALIHWLSVALVVACIAPILMMATMHLGAPARKWMLHTHLISGQLLFLFNLLRLSFFSAYGTPAADGADSNQRLVSRVLHALLYGVIGFLACTGTILAVANAAGQSVLGFQVPMLLTGSALGMARQMHLVASMSFILLSFVHILYVLALHYCFGQQTTLQKMQLKGELLDYLAGPEAEKDFARFDLQQPSSEQ